jgi:hypothetical protein
VNSDIDRIGWVSLSCNSCRLIGASAIFQIPSAAVSGFDNPVPIRDLLLASLRRCCRSLPDQRRGMNTIYDMADFALAAFAPFFMQSPSLFG